MTLIALGSLKASPGVTTAALALGASWPRGPRVAVGECDPACGDLTPRFGLTRTPGVVSLAAEARRAAGPELVWSHTQHLPGELPVLPGPAGPEQARAAIASLTTSFSTAFATIAADPDTVLLADCGRLEPGSPAMPIARQADRLLLLAAPVLPELAHLSAYAPSLPAGIDAGLVLVGPGAYSGAEIADTLGLPVRGELPSDRKAAAVLAGRHAGPRGLSRLPLLRAARTLAEALAQSPTATGDTGTGGACSDGQQVPASGREPVSARRGGDA